tara:strand:+ start:750 stop:977 length:228 start_codon:yes stop_codon:yes gene_type:complete
MPELIHTFTKGKMNKDLDERLLPNGEYRDALNLEVASSDTSQVGTFQNLKGNTENHILAIILTQKNTPHGIQLYT